MADTASVKESHPELYRSVARRYNEFDAWVKGTSALRDWMVPLGGMSMLDRVSDAILLDPAVQALGDQECTAMFPMLEDTNTDQIPAAAGAKVKLRGPYSPTVFAVLRDGLVQASPGVDGAIVRVWPQADVLAAVPVKASKLWAGAPAVQYVVKDGTTRQVILAHTCDTLLKNKWEVVQRTLTTW